MSVSQRTGEEAIQDGLKLPPQCDCRPIAVAVVASVVAHALLIVAMIFAAEGSLRRGMTPVALSALNATLADSRVLFMTRSATGALDPHAQPSIAHEPLTETLAPAQSIARWTPLRPNPFPVAATPVERGSGRVAINPVPAGEPLDPAFEQVLSQLYPNAVRSDIAFEVPPLARYPNEALEGRRQAHLRVLVIVRADGKVDLAEGSLHDPVFTAAVRTALQQSRAVPSGDPFNYRYTTLLFIFEYTGAN